MSSPLDEACALLNDFERECEAISSMNCPETHYRLWLHGETELLARNELERWLYGNLPDTATANTFAQTVYKEWRRWLLTAGIPKWTSDYKYDKKSGQWNIVPSQAHGETYYADDDRFTIAEPQKEETLLTFIVRLAREAEETGKGHRLQWRALKSFLDFIRNHFFSRF